MPVRITPLREVADTRGEFFTSPDAWSSDLASIGNVHLTEIRPGCVRGNHYHPRRRELVLIDYHDSFLLAWREGVERHERRFEGRGCVTIEFDCGIPHAIQNTGGRSMLVFSTLDGQRSQDDPDTVRDVLIDPAS